MVEVRGFPGVEKQVRTVESESERIESKRTNSSERSVDELLNTECEYIVVLRIESNVRLGNSVNLILISIANLIECVLFTGVHRKLTSIKPHELTFIAE